MNTYQAFEREFTAVVNDRPYTVAGNKLPVASLIKVFEYGFQRIINDKCGGMDKTAERKHEIATNTINRLLDGTIATRRVGQASADPLDYWRDKAAIAIIKINHPEIIKGKKGDDRAEAIDDWAEQHAEQVEKIARDLMEKDRYARAAIAALAGDVTI